MFNQANDYKKPSSSQPGVGAGSASQLQNAGVGAGSVRQLKNAGVGDGSVSQLKNARVDVRFASERLPPIMTVLKVPGNSTFLVVSQHLNANIVRTIAHGGTEELGRGQMVINTGHPITEEIMSKNVLFLESDHYFYRPRKYDPENRHMENNHVVLVVAEDVVQGIPVWEVVNIWGKEWGASGRFYLEKGAFGINKNVWVPDFTTFRLVGPGKDA